MTDSSEDLQRPEQGRFAYRDSDGGIYIVRPYMVDENTEKRYVISFEGNFTAVGHFVNFCQAVVTLFNGSFEDYAKSE